MKHLILILVLALAVQPLQAGTCDMEQEKNQEASHHMDHSGPDKHDCCDSDDTEKQEGCDGEMNCGPCFAGLLALPSLNKVSPNWGSHHYSDLSSSLVLPSHSSPPFRPPIS